MTVRFLGLIGALGVLPSSYTELAIDQRAFGDNSFAAFFDVFHHRLLQLFYRAWEKHHFFVGYELARARSGSRDAMSSYLLNLIGLGPAGLQNKLPFKDDGLLRYAGLILQRPHSAECLRALIQDFFRISVRIEQFLGKWHTLESQDLCALGSGMKNCELGCGALAGDAVWTRQSLVRAVLGPLNAKEFFRFLPCGDAFRKLIKLLRWFLGPVLDFEVQPVLASGEDPAWCRLGDLQFGGLRLGWSSWLTDRPFEGPATDAVFAELEGLIAEDMACH
jgi:type VI secretion system protein ImpH